MVVRTGTDQEETETSDLKKRKQYVGFDFLVYHENLVTIFLFLYFFKSLVNRTSSIFIILNVFLLYLFLSLFLLLLLLLLLLLASLL